MNTYQLFATSITVDKDGKIEAIDDPDWNRIIDDHWNAFLDCKTTGESHPRLGDLVYLADWFLVATFPTIKRVDVNLGLITDEDSAPLPIDFSPLDPVPAPENVIPDPTPELLAELRSSMTKDRRRRFDGHPTRPSKTIKNRRPPTTGDGNGAGTAPIVFT